MGVDLVPTATSLLIKELKEPARDRKKVKNITHHGNISKDALFNIARQMRFKSQAKEFKGTVREILGTAFAIGCKIDGKKPMDLLAAMDGLSSRSLRSRSMLSPFDSGADDTGKSPLLIKK